MKNGQKVYMGTFESESNKNVFPSNHRNLFFLAKLRLLTRSHAKRPQKQKAKKPKYCRSSMEHETLG
jgi:hypothetical protein